MKGQQTPAIGYLHRSYRAKKAALFSVCIVHPKNRLENACGFYAAPLVGALPATLASGWTKRFNRHERRRLPLEKIAYGCNGGCAGDLGAAEFFAGVGVALAALFEPFELSSVIVL